MGYCILARNAYFSCTIYFTCPSAPETTIIIIIVTILYQKGGQLPPMTPWIHTCSCVTHCYTIVISKLNTFLMLYRCISHTPTSCTTLRAPPTSFTAATNISFNICTATTTLTPTTQHRATTVVNPFPLKPTLPFTSSQATSLSSIRVLTLVLLQVSQKLLCTD